MNGEQYAEFWTPYAIAFAVANIILLALLVWLVVVLNRQSVELFRQRKLSSYLDVFTRFSQANQLRKDLYLKACQRAYQAKEKPPINVDLDRDIKKLSRSITENLGQIGILIHEGLLPQSFVDDYAHIVPIRVYGILRSDIQQLEKDRHPVFKASPFKYLVLLSIAYWAKHGKPKIMVDSEQPSETATSLEFDQSTVEGFGKELRSSLIEEKYLELSEVDALLRPSTEIVMSSDPDRIEIDLSAKKTEAGWIRVMDRFGLSGTPVWFNWLGWILVLGAFHVLFHQLNSIVLAVVIGISYAMLWIYFFGFFYRFEFKGLPLLRPRAAQMVSLIMSGLLAFASWRAATSVARVVATLQHGGS